MNVAFGMNRCYLDTMVKSLAKAISRFEVIAIILLAVAFCVPAFDSHACAAPTTDMSVAAGVQSVDAVGNCASCPDCGPSCAGGCCHAPHPGMAAETAGQRGLFTFERPSTWSHVVRAPMTRPSGPERPPRL